MDAKLAILSSILNQDDFFSINDIINDTEISKQLINYHLSKFTDHGYLERIEHGPRHIRFSVIDVSALVKEASVASDVATGTTAFDTAFWKNGKALNEVVTTLKQARTVELPYYAELRQATLDEINLTLRSLRAAKRNLTEHRFARQKTLKTIMKNDEKFIETYFEDLERLSVPFEKEKVKEAIIKLRDEFYE